MAQLYVDIDVDEFVDNCDSREIKELVEYLREEGHLDECDDDAPDEQMSVLDLEWAQVIGKISGRARLQLTNEEEDIIKKIANRF